MIGEATKRSAFRQLLNDIASDQALCRGGDLCLPYFVRLEELYHIPSKGEEVSCECQGFRHYYSDIFYILTDIRKREITDTEENTSIETLIQNIEILYSAYEPLRKDENGCLIDICISLKKLYDHVNLDVARLQYLEAEDRREIAASKTFGLYKKRIDNTEDKLKTISGSVDCLQDNLAKQQKEYIAILGIFSSVVLVFAGGVSFTSTVFNGIAKCSVYRLAFAVLLVGIVLVNVFLSLFHYLDKMIHDRVRLNVCAWFWSNFVLLALLGLTVAAWYFRWPLQWRG